MTHRILKALLLAGVTVSAAPGFALAQSAPTQASEGETQLQDIIVTSRRVEERLQDVPASVSVLTADALAQTGAKVTADFVKLTPGVTIVTGTAEAGDTQINIRGLNGARDAENNVALVVDGVLKTNTAALNQNQGAVQQVEVLKGPQGALYGRNASAGAIVITTKKPGDTLELQARASGGENTTFSGFAMVSAPISDNAGVVLSFDYDRTDGFFRNSFLPSALNTTVYPGNSTKAGSVDDAERWNINGRLVFNPTDATEIDLKARYGRVKSGSIAFNAVFQIPTLATVFNDPVFNIDVNDHAFLFTPNIDPNNDQKTFEASAKLKHDFGWAQLNGYVSYSNIKNDFFADGTSGAFGFFANEPTCVRTSTAVAAAVNQEPFERFAFAFGGAQPYSPSTCDGTQYQRRNQEDISVELRLSGTTMDTLSWQLGAYYLRLDRDVCVNLGIDTGRGVVEECFTADARNPTEALADDSFRTNVYALFGSLDYDVTDQFKIGLALRYDIEERGVSNNVPTGRRTRWVGNVLTGNPNGTATTPANYFLNPGLDPVYNPSGRLADRDATFKQLQPKISLSYALTPTHNLYANWGIGFKSGGFNSSGSEAIIRGFFNAAFNAGLSIFDQYDKERTSAFELGVKGSVLDGRVTYEVAGYYTDVKDMQFFEFFVGPFGLLRVVSNIDKVELYGAEFSTSVRIIDGWSVFGSANVTDSKIKANGARPNTVGNKSPYTSDYTINLGTQATLPITDGINGTLRVDWRLTGPTWFHTIQDNTVPNIFGLQGNFSNSQRDSYSTVNLRAGLEGDYWTVSFVANNLFDKKFLAEVIPAPEFGGDFISPGGRRFIGAEVGVKF